MGETAKKILDWIAPVHGNNTEARRAEKPSTESKTDSSKSTYTARDYTKGKEFDKKVQDKVTEAGG